LSHKLSEQWKLISPNCRLKMINVFEPCSLQIGDRNYYTLEENDMIITKDCWRRMQKEKFPLLPSSRKPLLSPKKVPSKDGDAEDEATVSSASISPAHLAPPPATASGSTSPSPTHLAPPSPRLNHLQVHSPTSSQTGPLRRSDTDDWDTDDTGSFSDTASLSSNCSNTSQGKF
jgi:ubiquitin-conjugating enzyme E2 O